MGEERNRCLECSFYHYDSLTEESMCDLDESNEPCIYGLGQPREKVMN